MRKSELDTSDAAAAAAIASWALAQFSQLLASGKIGRIAVRLAYKFIGALEPGARGLVVVSRNDFRRAILTDTRVSSPEIDAAFEVVLSMGWIRPIPAGAIGSVEAYIVNPNFAHLPGEAAAA